MWVSARRAEGRGGFRPGQGQASGGARERWAVAGGGIIVLAISTRTAIRRTIACRAGSGFGTAVAVAGESQQQPGQHARQP
jgi:hypothetical protein